MVLGTVVKKNFNLGLEVETDDRVSVSVAPGVVQEAKGHFHEGDRVKVELRSGPRGKFWASTIAQI